MLTVDFERLGVGPGMDVLDAGCGEGRHALEILRRGARPVAMDLNRRDLAHTRFLLAGIARERAPETAALVESRESRESAESAEPVEPAESGAEDLAPAEPLALQGNAQNLPFASGCFDRVICSEVLEHVRDPFRAAKELVRVLKPGGVLAVSVPTPMTEWAFRFASDDYFNTPGGHVRVFTPSRLVQLMGRVGVSVADIHFAHAFHSLYWWVRGVAGVHDERHPAIRHVRRTLTYTLFSPVLNRAERMLDWVVPKGMVFYFVKPDHPPPEEPPHAKSASEFGAAG